MAEALANAQPIAPLVIDQLAEDVREEFENFLLECVPFFHFAVLSRPVPIVLAVAPVAHEMFEAPRSESNSVPSALTPFVLPFFSMISSTHFWFSLCRRLCQIHVRAARRPEQPGTGAVRVRRADRAAARQ